MPKKNIENDVVLAFGKLPPLLSSGPQDIAIQNCLVFLIEGTSSVERTHVFVEAYWMEAYAFMPLGRAKLIVDEGTLQNILLSDPWHIIRFEQLAEKTDLAATFLGSRHHYRDLILLAGEERAKRLLLRAHDLAALQAFRPNNRVLRRLHASSAFALLVLTDEEQFAFLGLGNLFGDYKNYKKGIPPNIKEISTAVEIAPRTILRLSLEFPEVLRAVQPFTVIIGPNGSGKTRLLLGLARALTRRAPPRCEAKAYLSDGSTTDLKGSPIVVFTYEKHLWRDVARLGGRVVSLDVGRDNWRTLGLNLQRLATSENAQFNLAAFCRVIGEVVNVDDMYVPLVFPHRLAPASEPSGARLRDLIDRRTTHLATFLDPTQEVFFHSAERGRYTASSGQKSILLFMAHLYVEAANGALVFIDEPENHLHPRFISIMMQALRRALLATESRAVVVTHSPFVVREVDKRSVLIMSPDADGTPALYRTTLQTLGADVTAISDHAFFDGDVRKAYEVRIDEILTEAPDKHARDEAIAEVEAHVGRDAEFYLRMKTVEGAR